MKKFFVVIIGISVLALTAYVGMQLISKNVPDEESRNTQDIVKVNVPVLPSEEDEESMEDEVVKTDSKVQEENVEQVFALEYPVEGMVGMGYSPETLIYSKTLKEWTVHTGIDIQAKRGTPVKVAESGVIESISEFADMGIEIVVDHLNGYKTVYSNLSSKDMVSIGDNVTKGQVISGIGNTSGFEYYEPDHLHFEVFKDGKLVNPLEFLGDNSLTRVQ